VARRPVERLPLWHVLPGAQSLVATVGWSASTGSGANRFAAPLEALPALARAGGCKVVALSAADPRPVLREALRVVRRSGLLAIVRADDTMDAATCADLAEFADAAVLNVAPFHERDPASRERPCQVRDRIVAMRSAGVFVEVATPVERALPATAWLETALSLRAIDPEIPWHVIEARPGIEAERGMAQESARAVADAQAAGRRAGLHHVYAEASADGGGELTFCAACRDVVLIERFRGRPSSFLAAGGRCPNCRTRPAGLFETAAIA
jgi:pyruvate formate lyase activating enzyme